MCPHERQIDVHMRIDESGKDKLATRVNDLRSGWRRKAAAYPRDRLSFTPQIGPTAAIGRYDFTVLDQQGHTWSSGHADEQESNTNLHRFTLIRESRSSTISVD